MNITYGLTRTIYITDEVAEGNILFEGDEISIETCRLAERTHTHTQTNYSNPRSACTPRVTLAMSTLQVDQKSYAELSVTSGQTEYLMICSKT